jgi:hypothetical protein
MTWECTECGALKAMERCPVRCETCGTAGGIFVRSEIENELEVEDGSLLASWVRAGYERAGSEARR